MYFSSSYIVSATIPMCGDSRLMARVASTPPMRGMLTSIRMTSGCNSRVFSTASWPSRASPTTSRSPLSRKIAVRPSRTTRWSSAIRTLIRSTLPLLLRRDGDIDEHPGAVPLPRLHAGRSPDQASPLVNPFQAKRLPFGRVLRHGLHIETDPVVLDRALDPAFRDGQGDRGPVRLGVLLDVAERLLHDPEQHDLGCRRHRRFAARPHQLGPDVRLRLIGL